MSSPFYGGPAKFQCFLSYKLSSSTILFAVPRGHDPFGQHQESRPLAAPNTRNPRLVDSLFKSDKSDWLKTTERVLCRCSKIGSGQRS